MTRAFVPLLVALSLGAACAEGAKEAKALFEAVEAKLGAAKTLKVQFTSVMGPEEGRIEFASELWLGEGNQAKLSVEGEQGGKRVALGLTCDGTTTRTFQAEGERVHEDNDETRPHLGKLLRESFARASVVVPLFMLRVDKDDDVPFEVENFSLGPKERVGERSLQVIEYDVKAEHATLRVKLWVDTVSKLPAKRAISNDDQANAIVETYTKLELDAEFAEGTFVVEERPDAQPREAPTSKPAK